MGVSTYQEGQRRKERIRTDIERLQAKIKTLEADYEQVEIVCPMCDSKNVRKFGSTKDGEQRYQCKQCKHLFTQQTRTMQRPEGYSCPCGRNFVKSNSNKFLIHVKKAETEADKLLRQKGTNLFDTDTILSKIYASKRKYCWYYAKKKVEEASKQRYR